MAAVVEAVVAVVGAVIAVVKELVDCGGGFGTVVSLMGTMDARFG